MKRLVIFSLSLCILIAACNKNLVNASLQNGEYKGTFTRMHPTARYVPSNVSLTITGNRFTGTSDKSSFPAICSGSLTKKGNKLKVTNECMFTADFDWTYIFKGDFEYSISGKEIKLIKNYSPGFYDVYTLQKY
ncbi:MAG TPA: hypothetical protein VF622_15265 [Segetibacter sp.]|jgi:hypothetical protein